MQKLLDSDQIAAARALRLHNKSYREIKAELGLDVSEETIRNHCADVAPGGVVKKRVSKGASIGKDGRVIMPYTDADDAQIIAFVSRTMADRAETEIKTLADLARKLGRKHNSLTARILTLKKHGRIA